MNIYDFIKVDENGKTVFFDDGGDHVLIRAESEEEAKQILLDQLYQKYVAYAETFHASCIDLEQYTERYPACYYNFTGEDLA
jgi:hypothetical protein